MRSLLRTQKKWIGFTALCWMLTPIAFMFARIERGYDAIGGEALIPLIPIIAWLLCFAAKKSR